MSAGNEQAIDHVLKLLAACNGKVDNKGIYSLKWHGTNELVVPSDREARRRISSRRSVHIRSFWERGQTPPLPDLHCLSKFEQCNFINDLVNHSRSTSYITDPRDSSERSAMPPRTKFQKRTEGADDGDCDPSVDGSVNNQNPEGKSKGNKEKELERYRRSAVPSIMTLPLKRGSNPALNMMIGVNTRGRLSDNGEERIWSMFIIQKLLDPNDRDKVCAYEMIRALHYIYFVHSHSLSCICIAE